MIKKEIDVKVYTLNIIVNYQLNFYINVDINFILNACIFNIYVIHLKHTSTKYSLLKNYLLWLILHICEIILDYYTI